MAPFIRTPLPLSLLPSSHHPKISHMTQIERKALGAFFPLDPGAYGETTDAKEDQRVQAEDRRVRAEDQRVQTEDRRAYVEP